MTRPALRVYDPFPRRDRVGIAPPAPDARVQAAEEEAYQRGYLAGQAAGRALAEAEMQGLSARLVESIIDQSLTATAARAAAIRSALDLAGAVLRAAAPALGRAGLAAELREALSVVFERCPEASVRIACAPEAVSALAPVLAQARVAHALVEDPTLLPFEARVGWAGGIDQIDLQAAIDAVLERIAAAQASLADAGAAAGIEGATQPGGSAPAAARDPGRDQSEDAQPDRPLRRAGQFPSGG